MEVLGKRFIQKTFKVLSLHKQNTQDACEYYFKDKNYR